VHAQEAERLRVETKVLRVTADHCNMNITLSVSRERHSMSDGEQRLSNALEHVMQLGMRREERETHIHSSKKYEG
jgi:hypothetical protein